MLFSMILTETLRQQLYHSDKNKKFMLFTSLSARKYICADIICLIYMPDRSVLKHTPRFAEWNCCQVLNLLSLNLLFWETWYQMFHLGWSRGEHIPDNKHLEMVKARGFQGLWQNVFIYNNCCYVVV